MSLLEAVQSQLIIKTGDGKSYTPLWKNNCAKEIEYNIAQFDFPKVAGSIIDRGTPIATKFALEIYFQGENNLDDALAFEVSARDSRPWSISHPIYGSILVQPIGLKFDYSAYNAIQVSGTIIETLGSAGLTITIIPRDKIIADKEILDSIQANAFNSVESILKSREITAADIGVRSKQVSTLKGLNKALYDFGVKYVKLTEDAGTYLNLFNSANAAIEQIITYPQQAMQAIQAVVNFPGRIVTSIKVRLSVLQSQLNILQSQTSILSNRVDKKHYEVMGGAIVSTMTQGAVTSYALDNSIVETGLLPDYQTRADVLAIIELIKAVYEQYLAFLDSIQSLNGGSDNSYMPDADSLIALADLINYTIQNLYIIALSAKQERAVVLQEDSNVILLAHRFYGLLTDDSTIDNFIKTNNICLGELLQIRKGRTLIYYI